MLYTTVRNVAHLAPRFLHTYVPCLLLPLHVQTLSSTSWTKDSTHWAFVPTLHTPSWAGWNMGRTESPMRIGVVYVKCLPARWVQRTSLLVAFRAGDRRMSTSSSGNAVLNAHISTTRQSILSPSLTQHIQHLTKILMLVSV